MSKDVDRDRVLLTTRVRTLLKNDGSWIHRSKQAKEEQEEACGDCAAETKPVPVRQKSYVLSTAKKFGSVETPQSPPHQKTQLVPSEGDSANQANSEVIPPKKDAQPEGSTVETTDDTKPQASSEERAQTGEAQPEKSEAVSPVEPAEQSVAETTPEKKEECVDTPVDQSKVEHNEEAVEASTASHAEVIQNGETQPVSKEKTEAVSPVEPAEQPVADTTAEKKKEHVDAPVDLSDVEYNKGAAEASAAVHVEAPVAKTSAEAATEESKDAAEVPAVLTVELKPEVEPSTETEPTNVTNHEPAGEESTTHPAEGSCEKCPPEKYTEETVEAVAEVVEESLPETPAVTNAAAAAQEAAIQNSTAPVPDLLADTVSESPTQPATDTAVKSVESAAPAQSALNTRAEEESKGEVQAAVEPAPETTTDHATEMKIEDAVEPATASDVEAVQDKIVVKAIELTDALDVEAPTAEADPEPGEDPKQSHSEEVKPDQKSDDANNTETFEKPVEEQQSTKTLYKTRDGKAVCSFCDEIIDGSVKITFNEPLVSYHPECLKCGVCAEALGDLLTPMFLHDQLIHCGGCFAKAL
ncbi:neurofilament heavy polypeptide [Thunnus thynnus]|uniref:neurofilament heavy polypeptide n=1 Tax=Thunnus thynnus TaxID=8237 RepID=UPI003529ADFD